MKKIYLRILCCLFVLLNAVSAQAQGPDQYGYRWTQTTSPWIDITGTGTQLSGMGDDNVSAVVPIGFPFKFYWNSYTTLSVGSNGYLQFGTPAVIASGATGFTPYLATGSPYKNTMGPFLTDLTFNHKDGRPIADAAVYYQTIGTKFILSYVNVPLWNGDSIPDEISGRNTFQVVLNSADSSIIFNYQSLSGRFYSGYTARVAIGIASVSGVGLPVRATPPANGVAYRFHWSRPATPYNYRDVAPKWVLNSENAGIFAKKGQPVPVKSVSGNIGTQAAGGNTTLTLSLYDSNGISRALPAATYVKTLTPAQFPVGKDTLLSWADIPASFFPYAGTYALRCTTTTGNQGTGFARNNDVSSARIVVTEGAGSELKLNYTTDNMDNLESHLGPVGQYFAPPTYPATITAVEVTCMWPDQDLFPVPAESLTVLRPVLYRDGALPNASTQIQSWDITSDSSYATDTLGASVNDFGYIYVRHRLRLTAPLRIDSGGVYLGLTNPFFNLDTYSNGYVSDIVQPHSNRTFEITGGTWGAHRNRDSVDFSASIVTSLEVCSLQAPVLAGRDTSFCPGGSAVLNMPDTGNYVWNTGSTARSITVTQAGQYSIRRISGNCASDASNAITISFTPLPARPVVTTTSPANPFNICAGDSLMLTTAGARTALWSTGETNDTIYVKAAGAYSARIVGACTSQVSNTVLVQVVDPAVQPSITVIGNSTACAGDSTVLIAPAGFNYMWSNGAATNRIAVRTSGTYTVRTLSTSGSCMSAASVPFVFTVNPIPALPSFVASATISCPGDSIKLKATGVAGVSFLWSNGATGDSIYVKTGGAYTVRAMLLGCTSAVSASRTVNFTTVGTPVITAAIPADTNFCNATGRVTLQVPTSGGARYLWSTGATTRTILVTTPGVYTVRYIVGVCTSVVSNVINVRAGTPPAAATITAGGPLSFCAGDSVTLTASRADSIIWSTGARTQSITVKTAGSYTVSTYNAVCTTASTPVTVIVNTAPARPAVTVFSGSLTLCEGSAVVLRGPAGLNYIWSTGETTRAISITTAGTYTLQTYTGACTSVASLPRVVIVTPAPARTTFTVTGATSFCTGDSVILTAARADSIIWSNGLRTQRIKVTTGGNYYVRTYNPTCTTNSDTVVVTVNTTPGRPTVTVNTGSLTLCEGNTVTLSGPAGFSYLWSNGVTTRTNPITTPGTYTLQTYNGSCTSVASLPRVVTVTPPPAATTITAGGPLSICSGSNVVLTAGRTDSIIWSTGARTQSITVTTAGSYTVSVYNAACTVASAATVVTVTASPAKPAVTLTGTLTFCEGGQATLTGPATGIDGYLWSNGETTRAITVTTSGTYTLQTIVASCTSVASNPRTFTVDAIPAAPSLTYDGTTFTAGAGGVTYLWARNGATVVNQSAATYSTTQTGTYTVRAVSANGCTSAYSIPYVITGINQLLSNNLKLSPNPAGSAVYIEGLE
ncbi:MAG: hypothetical protein V4543_03530, partial [Bacteroidota bacterium]